MLDHIEFERLASGSRIFAHEQDLVNCASCFSLSANFGAD